MAFAVSLFFFWLFFVISVAFQVQWTHESKGRAIGPRSKRALNTAMFDLEKHVTQKLVRKYKSEDKILEWILMNGSHPEIAGKSDLTNSVVKVDAKNAKPGAPSQPKDKISGLFTNLYCNSQNMPLSSTIKQIVKRNSTFTYRAKKGLKRINKDGIPIELPLPSSLQRTQTPVGNLKINLMGKKSDAQTVTDTHELDHNVTVAPSKAKMVTITVIYKVVNMDYEADLVLTGAVVAKFKGKNGPSEYASHPITDFGDSNYVLEGNSLVFHTSGQFTGSRAFNVDVKEEEMSADQPACKHEELQSQGDVRVIHLKAAGPKIEDLTD